MHLSQFLLSYAHCCTAQCVACTAATGTTGTSPSLLQKAGQITQPMACSTLVMALSRHRHCTASTAHMLWMGTWRSQITAAIID